MKRDAEAPAEEHGSAHIVEVLRTEMAWNGTPYEAYPSGRPELTVLRFALPPNSSLPWHEHIIPSAAFVIAGSITLEDAATGDTRTVNAGEAFGESLGAVHRGFTGSEETDIVVTYAAVAGVPLSIPRPGEGRPRPRPTRDDENAPFPRLARFSPETTVCLFPGHRRSRFAGQTNQIR